MSWFIYVIIQGLSLQIVFFSIANSRHFGIEFLGHFWLRIILRVGHLVKYFWMLVNFYRKLGISILLLPYFSLLVIRSWKWKVVFSQIFGNLGFMLNIIGIFVTDYQMPITKGQLEPKFVCLSVGFVERMAHWKNTIWLERPCNY